MHIKLDYSKKHIFIFFFIFFSSIYPQIVYEPIESKIYSFLDNLSSKGIIELDDIITPYSRTYIASKLIDIKKNEKSLTTIQKEELDFFIKDFGLEIDMLDTTVQLDDFNYFGKDKYDRIRLLTYSDDLFKINISPILGYEYGSLKGESYLHRWNGLRFYGYLGTNIGFSFEFRDNMEKGENLDWEKDLTRETGVIRYPKSSNSFEYNEVRTNLSYNWNWGEISIGKDFMEWGYGESGKLVLSNKAPSFPFIRLDIRPTDWLSFNYMHCWISSDVVDSNEIYNTYFDNAKRIIYRDKYLATHTLNIFPIEGLTISLGESIVYSDEIKIEYLIPLMFFRLADHYRSRNNNSAGDNSQFYFSVSSRNHVKNTHLYSSLFIDEITISGLFDKQKQRNQFGFTLGGSVFDLPFDNLKLTVEYTKIYPFVYEHYIPTQTYQSNSYEMGHWMGDNADQIYGSLKYKFMRGLDIIIWGEYIRKGSEGIVDQQYEQPQPPFLFGYRKNHTHFGVNVSYEILHELFVRARYQNTKISGAEEDGTLVDEKYSTFTIALSYGL
ncbi:MAG: hypothetical protein JXA68_05055 [Ignavibacteriales bacterium]|nr:hypothetical protein [Ignavibacteriales bacterium]